MYYIPGTIAALFGVYFLIRALMAKTPGERNANLGRAGIDFAIAIALVVLNFTALRQ